MAPADPRDIAQIVAGLFMASPSQALSVDAQKAKIGLFVEALEGLPLWALKAASLKWRRGEVPGNAAFAPSAGELRRVADGLTLPHRAAIAKLNRVLSAQPLRSEEMPPEVKSRIAAKFSDLARSISDNARREAQ